MMRVFLSMVHAVKTCITLCQISSRYSLLSLVGTQHMIKAREQEFPSASDSGRKGIEQYSL